MTRATRHEPPEVHAAGGIPWRNGSDGTIEVLVVSRVLQQDWSFPKGKCEPGEDDETCARREVEEETGLRCALGEELPTARYTDRHGRPKRVRYWAMTVVGAGTFDGDGEIESVQWATEHEAAALLSYESDRELLVSLVSLLRALP